MEHAWHIRDLRRTDRPCHRFMEQQAIPKNEHDLHNNRLSIIHALHGYGQLDATSYDLTFYRPYPSHQATVAEKGHTALIIPQ